MKRDPHLVRLSREHTQALMLAQRIARSVPHAEAEELGRLYASLIRFWAAGLLPHFTAEGECLLARLIRHLPEEHDDIRRLQHDHLQMAAFVALMRDATDLDQRRALILEFGETLRTHVRWEEERLFATTEAELSDDELAALGADLAERLPEHPRPWDAP